MLMAVTAAVVAAAPINPRFTGVPFLTKWDSNDYAGASGNYYVVQHPQTGFVYIGNNYGVLEFDGAYWRLVRLRDDGVVPVVLVDSRGAVWLGSSNAIAVLRPDAQGELQAADMTDRLPAAEQKFGRLYLAAAGPDGVYFASPTHLVFLGHDGTTRTWPSGPIHFNGLSWFDGALYASHGEAGLFRLEKGEFVFVAPPPLSPNPAVPDTLRLFAAQRETGAAESILLTDVGPMRWPGPGRPMVPLSATASAHFAQESATTAAFLRDGRFAFFIRQRGLVVLNADGSTATRLTSTSGLPKGEIHHVASDREGGLWLAQVNGVARLQLESRFATQVRLDAANAFLRRGERLYIAGDTGVVWRDDTTGEMHPVSGFPTSPSSLVSVGDRVFGTGQFLREITPDDQAVVALPVQLNSLAPLPGVPGAFVGGSVRGLRLLRFDAAGWHDDGLVRGVTASVANVLVDRDGFVWASGYTGAPSWRVDFRRGPRLDATTEQIDAAFGLPIGRGTDSKRWMTLGEEVLAVRGGRMLRYDRTAGRFVPEDRIDNLPPFERVSVTAGPDGDQWWLVQSPTPQIVHVVRTAEQHWRAEAQPAGPLQGLGGTSPFFDPPTGTLWIGGRGPPITVDPAWRPTGSLPPFEAVIRRITTPAGEVLLGGLHPAVVRRTGADSLRFPPTQNSLRIAFAAPRFTPDYNGAIRTVFRTRLEGVEQTWTGWSPTPWREFTDLPYRDFTFRVQGRDVEGRESTVGTLAFSIAPPWWLSWPAFAGYVALGILAIMGLFRLRTRALRRRNAHLEILVAARTAELERLRRLEMDEKISARLAEEKARLEVLRYQLNPHFLFNSLNSIYALVWSHSRPAGELVRRLAEFCRMTLTRGGAETATLADEFTMLRAYLGLEQVRWEENLQVDFSLAPEIEAVRLPPFLLLPLVENAVKYGGHTSPGLLQLRVTARPDAENAIVIEIANTGTWVEPGSLPAVASTSIGLENLRQRLARHYPGAHEFDIKAGDGWVTMRLRLGRGRHAAADAAEAATAPIP